jgi:hypothetical protein
VLRHRLHVHGMLDRGVLQTEQVTQLLGVSFVARRG